MKEKTETIDIKENRENGINAHETMKEEPWINELNSLHFVDEDTNYKCFIMRHFRWGFLRGYVIVPPELVEKAKNIADKIGNVDVHGSVSFQDQAYWQNEREDYAIGFDCGHFGDLTPYIKNVMISREEDTYKDINFVQDECRKLAKQLRDLLENEEL